MLPTHLKTVSHQPTKSGILKPCLRKGKNWKNLNFPLNILQFAQLMYCDLRLWQTVVLPLTILCLKSLLTIYCCQMVQYSNAIWLPNSPAIQIPDKWMPFCFLKFWSSIQMVGLVHKTEHINWPFEYRTIWNQNFKKVGIQIPTVVK